MFVEYLLPFIWPLLLILFVFLLLCSSVLYIVEICQSFQGPYGPLRCLNIVRKDNDPKNMAWGLTSVYIFFFLIALDPAFIKRYGRGPQLQIGYGKETNVHVRPGELWRLGSICIKSNLGLLWKQDRELYSCMVCALENYIRSVSRPSPQSSSPTTQRPSSQVQPTHKPYCSSSPNPLKTTQSTSQSSE